MENASKALIIAAEILIGVIILTLFAIVFTSYSRTSEQVGEQMTAREIKAFNMQFLKYVEYDSNGQMYMAAPNIVTIANLADEINSKNGYNMMTINSCVGGFDGITTGVYNTQLTNKYFYDSNGNLKNRRMYTEITNASGEKRVVTVYYITHIYTGPGGRYTEGGSYTKEGRLKLLTFFLHTGDSYYKDEQGQFKKI